MDKLIEELIKEIETNYKVGAIGYSIYKSMMAKARQLQVEEVRYNNVCA